MKKKLKPVHFKVPAIGSEHYVYVCVDTRKNGLKKVSAHLKGFDKEKYTLKDFEVRGKTFKNSATFPFMWVDIEGKDFLATVAHEACHCAMEIFDYNDIDIKNSEEVFAILVGSIVRSVITEMK